MRAAISHLQKLLILLGRPVFFVILSITYLISLVANISSRLASHLIFNTTRVFPFIPTSKPKRLTSKLRILARPPKLIQTKKTNKKYIYLRPHFPYKLLLLFLFIDIVLSLIIASAIFTYYFIIADLPDIDRLATDSPSATTRLYDRQGVLLYQIYDSQNRIPVSLYTLPPHLINAHIAIEDADFFKHRGVSLKDSFRAIRHNLPFLKCYLLDETCNDASLQGGSTITQQLAKNTLLSPERTLQRKLREIILAYQIESRYTKDQILEKYLNLVSYGGTAYGIEAAARTYFGKPASQLDLAESALLAGLPAAPSAYSPFGAQPQHAKTRQTLVLQRMYANNFISHQQLQSALSQPLSYITPDTTILAPHFVMYTRHHLEQLYGSELVSREGLQIITSLDLSVQNLAQLVLNAELDKLKSLHVTEGAVLVTKPDTGEILAMVGSRNYFDTAHQGNFNATTALRQPGSSIKPINYATALSLALKPGNLETSKLSYTPATLILDAPVSFTVPDQPAYTPVNYDGQYHGQVSLRTALASSYNIPAVKVLDSYGVDQMISMGRSLGITTWDQPERFGLSLTLGGGEVTMTDMAVAYGTFANLGTRVSLNPILNIPSPHENLNFETSKLGNLETNPLDPQVAFLINHILADNQARLPAFGRYSKLDIPGYPVAVKTGTSNDLRDNWTIGYTPDYLVAVWVGNFDNSPMSRIASGITGAAPVWNQIMTYLLTEYDQPTDNQISHFPTFPISTPAFPWTPPPGLVQVDICPYTNTLPCSGCPSRPEWFISGTQPTRACAQFTPHTPTPTPPQ